MNHRSLQALGAVATVAALVGLNSASGAAGGATPSSAGGLTRLLPPPDGEAYFGFTVRWWDSSDPADGDSRPFGERVRDSIEYELAGKTPTFLTVWAAWQDPNASGKPLLPFSKLSGWISNVRGITGVHSLLYLDWTLTSTTAQNGGITTKNIASGGLDRYIRQYARDLKYFADPVLIRLFGGEFNGSWWYGQSPRANPNLMASDFVAAWRRVVDIFRRVGADNVSFAWIPNVYRDNRATNVDPYIAAYYPGDYYVDWAGADTYDYAAPDWLDPVYAFAVAHSKPFFLAEWGVRHPASTLTPAQEQAWIGSMFDYFASHPDIKAISYFNYDGRVIPWDPSKSVYLYGGQVNYLPNVNDGDSRLLAESGADFRGTYANRIASPRYIPTILSQQVSAPTRCLVPNVKNRRLVTARRMILAHHCSIGRIRRTYSKLVKKGHLISQKPKPPAVLPNHGKVDLVASRGRKP